MKGYEGLQSWTWGICPAVLFGTVAGLFFAGSRDADWSLSLTGKDRFTLALAGILSVFCMEDVFAGAEHMAATALWESLLLKKLLWSMFGGCLLAAAVMDWWEQMVYRFVWWAAGMAAGLLLLETIWENGVPWDEWELLVSLAIYVLLQELLFARFYGRADCHAFSVCAVMLAVRGGGLRHYLTHMVLVFGSLALVQLTRRNIGKNGYLKAPVPLIPYIVAAFWFLVDFSARRWYI